MRGAIEQDLSTQTRRLPGGESYRINGRSIADPLRHEKVKTGYDRALKFAPIIRDQYGFDYAVIKYPS